MDAFKIVTGASSGTQLDEANKVDRHTTHHTKPRGQQHNKDCQPANLNTVTTLHFAGKSEDRSLPPSTDSYMQTSVDHGRQSTQANRPAASHPSTATPLQVELDPIQFYC